MAKFEIKITRTYQKFITVECPNGIANKYNMVDKLKNAMQEILNRPNENGRYDVKIDFNQNDLAAEDIIEVQECPTDVDFLVGEDNCNNLEFYPSFE